jgi:DNA-binding PadR family transcriptional regulator
LRRSRQTLQVLEAFLEAPKTWRYGYDISQDTGLKSGTLYPILMRLEERKLLEATWKSSAPGTPPRHLYRLTPTGLSFARDSLAEHNKAALRRPTFSGAERLAAFCEESLRSCCRRWFGMHRATAGPGPRRC